MFYIGFGKKVRKPAYALRVRGAYIWRGLFSEFYGIHVSAIQEFGCFSFPSSC